MPILNRRLLNSTALTNISLISAGMLLIATPAMANPQGGQVVGGQATIVQSAPNTLTVNQQSGSAAINWQSFSIGKNETTDFNQPNSSSIAVNRVTGVDPSQIMGHLNANGQVVLVNPNGVLFTKSAQVNVGSLVVSTSGITEKNAVAGNLVFDQGSNAGAKIVNNGTITAKQGGLVALVSPSVINNGVISAKLGKVSLAAGDKWTLDLYGDRLVSFALNDKVAGEVSNTGRISANGGTVELTANVAKDVVNNAINMSGIVEASSVSQQGGTIVLDAGGGNVSVTGKLAAKGTTGGTIEVTGNDVALDGATVNASGTNGGGTIDIGGEAHGGGTLAHAQSVTVDSSTKLIANAKTTGNGGNVTVWSDGNTTFAGSASAKGGSVGGNGGTVETSGENLDFSAANVDTSAVAGATGTWLLDPTTLTINAAGAQALEHALGVTPGSGTTNVLVTTSSSNFGTTSSGAGDINVDASVTWNTNNSLILSAYDSINVNAKIIDAGKGDIVLRADNTGTDTGSVNVAGNGAVETGGAVSIYYDPTSYLTPATYLSTKFGGNVGGANGAFTAYMLVNNVADLDKVSTNLAGDYALGKNISAVGAFNPIGGFSGGVFSGIFDGNGGLGTDYSIDGLSAVGVAGNFGGLFGWNTGTIRNVTLTNETVSGTQFLGGLVGYNAGTLVNDSVTNVKVISNSYANSQNIGGLVGYNGSTGFISGGSVTGEILIGALSTNGGGFVGTNYGTILGGSFTGTVDAGCVDIGGFVGYNTGYISGASTSALVENGGAGTAIGGFAGLNEGRLVNDTATNAVVTTWAENNSGVGGFVGENISGGSIVGGYVQGTLTVNSGNADFGGFVGYNTGSIVSSTSDVSLVIGDNVTNVGGFAGYNTGSISNNKFTFHGITAGSGSTNVGGYVGYNAGGTLSGISLTGEVVAGDGGVNIGGLVGYNHGSMVDDGFTGTVTSGGNSLSVGGGVGLNFGSIQGLQVSGLVQVNDNTQFAGGAIGANYGGVSDSSFTGTVTAGCYDIGGFVGGNFGTITDSYATGSVSNGYYEGTIGGFAGENAISTVNGKTYTGLLQNVAAINSNVDVGFYDYDIGGLAGYNSGTILGAFDSGSVYAGVQTYNVGGLIGYNAGVVSGVVAGDTVHALSFSQNIGGLMGTNEGTVSAAAAAGSVLVDGGNVNVGGFIGYNGTTSKLAGGVANQASVNAIIAAINHGFGTGGAQGSISGGSAPVVSSSNTAGVTVNDIGGGSSNVGGYIGFNDGATVSGVTSENPITVADGSSNVGGFIGKNTGKVINDKFVGNLTVGSSVTAAGGLVGYNSGLVSVGTVSGNLVAGNDGFYVGGGVGWNDAGGTVTGLTVSGNVTGGSSSTGVGGIVGLNGSDATNHRGSFAAANASVSNSSYSGTVTVGDNSFAVAGLVGWNSQWTDTSNNVRVGIIDDATVSGLGTVSSPANGGTTFIHNANQDGCDERAGENCFGIAGLEAITVSPNDLTMTYNGAAPVFSGNDVTYTFTVPGETGTVNGLESGDKTSQIVQVTLTETNPNSGVYTITGSAVIDPANPNALLDYSIDFNPNGSTVTINKANVTVTPTGSQTYGGTNINVSLGYTGLVGADQGNGGSLVTGVTTTTTAQAMSPVAGTYTITAHGGTAQNYNVIDETGAYIINKADVTVTPTGSQTYGGTNVNVSYGYTGLIGTDQGQGSTLVTGVTTTTTAQQYSPVAGTYTISAVGGNAANYNVIDGTGAFTINKANVTVTPTGSQLVGGGDTSVSYGVTGLLGPDQGTGTGLISSLTYSTTAGPNSPAGNYLITALGGIAANYNVIDGTGPYTVGDVPANPSNPSNAGGITPLTAANQGSLIPLNQLLVTVANAGNLGNQITCLKVNAEVRGVTTDSPIDCSSPLQVNGF